MGIYRSRLVLLVIAILWGICAILDGLLRWVSKGRKWE